MSRVSVSWGTAMNRTVRWYATQLRHTHIHTHTHIHPDRGHTHTHKHTHTHIHTHTHTQIAHTHTIAHTVRVYYLPVLLRVWTTTEAWV
jgi:hypothetical protein